MTELVVAIVGFTIKMMVCISYCEVVLGYKKRKICVIGSWVCIDIVFFLLLGRAMIIPEIIRLAAMLFWTSLCCKNQWKKKIFVSVWYITINQVVKQMILVGISLFGNVSYVKKAASGIEPSIEEALIEILSALIIYIILRIFVYFRVIKDENDICFRYWAVLTLGAFVGFMYCIYVEGQIKGGKRIGIIELISLMVALYISIAVHYVYSVAIGKYKAERESFAYKKQLNIYEQWYEGVKQKNVYIEAFKHDLNNHITVLGAICREAKAKGEEKKAIGEIENYLNEIGARGELAESVKTGSLIIDSVLDMKKNYARTKSIELKIHTQIYEGYRCNNMDAVIIFGNLIDNAIEAAEKTEEKTVEVIIKYAMNSLFIKVKNSYNRNETFLTGEERDLIELKTSKKEKKVHGYGIKNVDGIVKKYNGKIEWDADDKYFLVSILLYSFGCER